MDAGNRWIFPDLADTGLQPHPGVRSVLLMGSTKPTHAVDVTDHLDAGVASLQAHAAYLAGLGYAFDAAGFIHAMTAAAGPTINAEHAAAFEVLSVRGI